MYHSRWSRKFYSIFEQTAKSRKTKYVYNNIIGYRNQQKTVCKNEKKKIYITKSHWIRRTSTWREMYQQSTVELRNKKKYTYIGTTIILSTIVHAWRQSGPPKFTECNDCLIRDRSTMSTNCYRSWITTIYRINFCWKFGTAMALIKPFEVYRLLIFDFYSYWLDTREFQFGGRNV